jgi:hypothetical protein
MSGNFFGGSSSSGATKPELTGVQIQTSVSTLPIPWCRGQVRVAPNIIWAGKFQAIPVSSSTSGKGGSDNSGNQTYDYKAALIMALCEGPISGIGQIWKGQSTATLSALGLTLFDGTTPQSPWGWLESYDASQALGYQGTAYVCKADYDLGSSATLDNYNFEVMTGRTGTGANGVDADCALVVLDFLTSPQDGIGFSAASIDMTTLLGANGDSSYQTYCRAVGFCMSPCLVNQETGQDVLQRWMQMTNTAVFWSGELLKFVPYADESITGNGVTFNPNVTPIYDLDDTDFVYTEGQDPIEISVDDAMDAYNVERLEIYQRSNAYNAVPIQSDDQNAIELYGLNIDSTYSAHEFCDAAVAQISGQLMLQRELYVLVHYKFRLSWEYCLLEPMDIVSLTRAIQNLLGEAVRITDVEEDDGGLLTFTCEELPAGVATATAYPKQGINPYSVNRAVQADPVNPPVIFEPAADLSGGAAQVWIGVSGGLNGAADPNWGGAQVLVSPDNTQYEKIGIVENPCRQGFLTTALPAPAGTGADTVNTLAVTLAESGGVLGSGTQADAQAGRTLCWVDGEIIAYATATLTAPNQYSLTYLERGLYGTEAVAHVSGTQFLRLDNTVFKYDLPKQYVGAPIWLKFISFNVYGDGFGDLAESVAYTLTPTGAGYFVAPPTNLAASQAVVSSQLGMRVDVTVTWTPSVTSWVTDYQVSYQMGNGAWTTFTTDGQPEAVIPNVLDADYTIKVAAIGLGLTSEPAQIVWNVTTDSLELPAVTGLELAGQGNVTQFVGKDAHFDWRMNSSYGSSEALSDTTSAGSNFMDSWFQNYRVTIFDLNNNALRTEVTTDPAYTYTYEKNAEDGPNRTFRIEVVWTDKLNRVSAPASITVSNPPPAFPTKIIPLSAFKTVSVQYTPPTDTDYAGTLVFMRTESFGGVNPVPADLVYDGTDTLINVPAVAGTEYFLVLASYDSFGETGLNYSSEYTTTTGLVGSTDIAQAAVTTQALDAYLNSAIDLVTGPAEAPGTLAAAYAAISSESTTRNQADQALAQQITSLSATLGNNYATFTYVGQAIAGINSASSTFLQQLNATVGVNTVSLQTQAQTINGLSAQYTVKIDNNGHVSGFGLASTAINGVPFSSFVVSVNDFAVASPGATSFALEVVNGVVTIPSVAIQDASITNAKIGTLAVDNSNIVAGAATVAGSVNIGAQAGTGGYVNIATVTFTLKSTATVIIDASWGVSYDTGYGNTNQQFFGQIYGGAGPVGPVLHTGTATTQTPAYMWATTLAAGSYNATFWWQGDNSHVQILAGSMTVFGMQK